MRYDEILDILENLDVKQMTRKLASHFKEIHAFPVFEVSVVKVRLHYITLLRFADLTKLRWYVSPIK